MPRLGTLSRLQWNILSFIYFIPVFHSRCTMLLIYTTPEWRFKEESITLLMESVRIRLWHNEDASFLLHSIRVLSWKDFQDSFLITSLWARLVDLLGWMYRSEYLPVTSPCSLCLSERVIWVLSRSMQVGGFQRSSLPGEACGRWVAYYDLTLQVT